MRIPIVIPCQLRVTGMSETRSYQLIVLNARLLLQQIHRLYALPEFGDRVDVQISSEPMPS
jgi:hypothetical protein